MDIGSLFIDVKSLPETPAGFVQLLFLGGTYGYILCVASNMISDGSELLLLVPSMAGLIGSVVLPVLGAVPDGCMVLFSGLGPDAQEQLNVGIGTLAGSTIMLLTMPWFLSILGGRVNIDPRSGEPNYKGSPKLDPGNMFNSGVTISKLVHMEAYIMLLTAMTYLVLQVPGMMYLDKSRAEQAEGEKIFAQIGACLCLLFFCGYLYLQYQHSGAPDSLQDKSRDEYVRWAIANKKITLLGVMLTEYEAEVRERGSGASPRSGLPYHKLDTVDETTALKSGENQRRSSTSSVDTFSNRFMTRLRKILRPFFKVYDADGNDSLQLDELRVLLEDLGESLSRQEVLEVFSKFDTNKNGSIDYEEFVQGVCDFIIMKQALIGSLAHQPYGTSSSTVMHRPRLGSHGSHASHRSYSALDLEALGQADDGDSTEGSEEEDEIPDDLKELTPEEQQTRIKLRALYYMGLGSLIVIVISDPMVDVLSEIGKRTGISAFYIAFVLAPMASNASELVAAYNYAQKKTRATISISLATLLGAAIMNNTFVLCVFMMLVATQGLSWEFFAETLSILLVQCAMAAFALKKFHTMVDAYLIIALYPLSLALVYVLEAYGWD